MSQFIINENDQVRTVPLQERITTVGTQSDHSVQLKSSDLDGLLFTVSKQAEGHKLLSQNKKVTLNGKKAADESELQACDQIAWPGGRAVYVPGEPVLEGAEVEGHSELKSLQVLHRMAGLLSDQVVGRGGENTLDLAVQVGLKELIRISNAEYAYLLAETRDGGEWKVIGSSQDEGAVSSTNRKQLLSSTILNETLAKRELLYIENIIGHQLANAASVVAARVFSVACLPLIFSGKVVGALMLYTRSPGRSIDRHRLSELQLLATQLAFILQSTMEMSRVRGENAALRGAKAALGSGSDAKALTGMALDRSNPKNPMIEVEKKVHKLGKTPLNLVVTGETGTGKEVVANEIHQASPRYNKPFVAINCAAIPETLLEATLFGYERGAFTGAHKKTPGKFVQANGGTLFLDEIGDLQLDLQAKLLRVIQEKKVEPLGSTQSVPVDVRIVAATHKELKKMIQDGSFRQDLYFRLAGASIDLPALRDRPGDIPVLADVLLKKHGVEKALSDAAFGKLAAHAWPGNIRELENVLLQAAYLGESHEISEGDLNFEAIAAPDSQHSVNQLFDELDTMSDDLGDLNLAQQQFTGKYVQSVLKKCGGNRKEAAKILKVSERTLYRILASSEEEGDA